MTIRKLTKEEYEMYSGAAIRAVKILPFFRDAISVLRPFYDENASTIYVDPYARIGLMSMFFDAETIDRRATIILHEAIHVMNKHFERSEAFGMRDKNSFLIAADCEVGTTLNLVKGVDQSELIVPGFNNAEWHEKYDFASYPMQKTFEQYYQLVKSKNDELNENKDGQGQSCPSCGEDMQDSQGGGGSSSEGDSGQNSQGGGGSSSEGDSGQNSQGGGGSCPSCGKKVKDGQNGGSGGQQNPCAGVDESKVGEIDEAGVERAGETEREIARKNTAARIDEARKGGRGVGNGHSNELLDYMYDRLKPAKVQWRAILARVASRTSTIISRGRSDHSYRKVNKKIRGTDFIFPGMIQYHPKGALGIDTSGSMGSEDNMNILSEVESILNKTQLGRNGIKVFSIDTEISGAIQSVKSLKDIKFHGGGGTNMAPAFDAVKNMPRRDRPDVFILASDGEWGGWDSVIEKMRETQKIFTSIILITRKHSMQGIPEEAHSLGKIICIDED